MNTEATPHPDALLQRVAPMIGVPGPVFEGPDAVNAAMVRHWCAALGDRNPVYVNEALARASVHGGLVAPPAMLQAWIMPGYGVAIDQDLVFAARAVMDGFGYTSVVATNIEQEYLRALRMGERVRLVRTVTAVSGEKATALGPGRFITSRYDLLDGDDRPVAVMLHRSLKFKPSPKGDARTAAVAPKPAAPAAPATDSGPVLPVVMRGDEHAIGYAQQALADLPPTPRAADVPVGARLTPLVVENTRSFIVAAAMATRDYQPVHHDPDVARARGSRDIFTNILTTTGLVQRVVTDCLGPQAQLRRIALRLGVPNYAGDTLRLTGSVVEKADDGVVHLAVSGRNTLGEHVSARVTVQLPL